SDEACHLLEKEYKSDVSLKRESEKITQRQLRPKKEVITIEDRPKNDDEDEDYPGDDLEIGDLKKAAAAVSKPKEKKPEYHEEIPRDAFIQTYKVVDKVDINNLPGMKKKPADKPAEPHVSKEPPKIKKQPEEPVKEQPVPQMPAPEPVVEVVTSVKPADNEPKR
ncbi:MAG TPA: hypothetical protein PKJ24_07335, partial [Prolixibacteraceae bacterium]|nr:hypothetical protein [Prolixibacteraceae bacterium]